MSTRDTAPLEKNAPVPGARPTRRAPEISLVVFHQEGAEVLPLDEGDRFVIGRAPDADVSIADRNLSKEHALLEWSGDNLMLRDLGSLNGTFVNGEKVREAKLRVGDELSFGGAIAVILARGQERSISRGVDSDEQFRQHLDAELTRAQYFQRPLAVLFVSAPSLNMRFVERVREFLSPVDRVAFYSPDTLELLLVEGSRARATELARALSEDATRVKIAIYPESGLTAEELLSAAAEHDDEREPKRAVAAGAAMRAVFELAERVAKTVIPVLITGETGSGKEVVARAIHQASKRAGGPFIALNCGAIPKQLVESTLFGHEKGAFTGADENRRGAFESASGGTLFLDELGELPPDAQTALLRVLETKQLSRVGSTAEIAVDTRVVAATHRDLEALCAEGVFRTDLYYRLNAMVVEVPPLRARPEEIRPLAEYFLAGARTLHGTSAAKFDPAVFETLALYDWPGNIRELRNVIERAAVLARGETITVDELPPRVRALAPESVIEPPAAGTLREKVEAYEAQLIREALAQTNNNQTEAARALGLPRRTLVHKLRALRISGK